MGKNSGGSSSGGGGGVSAAMRAKLKDIPALSQLNDHELKKEVMAALAEYEKEIGLPTHNIELGYAGLGALGSTEATKGYTFKDGKIQQEVKLDKVVLSKKDFNDKAGLKTELQNYKVHVKTDKPFRQTVQHELAHATWMSDYTGSKYKAAGKDIRALYKAWHKDSSKSGYGSYSHSSVDEFWAETVSKSFHGKSDKYTSAVRDIIKKHGLGK